MPGRIILLIDSIRTMKGIRTPGVLCGTKWANMCLEWLIHPNNIKDTHIGKDNDKVRAKCLVLVKIYGNSPAKLLWTIRINNLITIIVLPTWDEGPNKVLNSECKVLITILITVKSRLGTNQ